MKPLQKNYIGLQFPKKIEPQQPLSSRCQAAPPQHPTPKLPLAAWEADH
uniref:Uncharacterized protein n=1 Tax=viral metagenome TaxID=1070528 RepID=A0A6C0K772_9ZZZZ